MVFRCSICQAVTPLTATVSAAAAETPSGTATRSAAASTWALAQLPTLVTAANRRLGQGRVDVRAGRSDRADDVVAGDERERWLTEVLPEPHLLLGEGNAGRVHAQDDLARGGRRKGAGADLEAGDFDLARQDDLGGGGDSGGSHGGCSVRSVVLTAVTLRALAYRAQELTLVSFMA